MAQTQSHKPDSRTSTAGGDTQSTSKAAPRDDATAELLDEIDTVLEQNAEEFVKAFVQKGGE